MDRSVVILVNSILRWLDCSRAAVGRSSGGLRCARRKNFAVGVRNPRGLCALQSRVHPFRDVGLLLNQSEYDSRDYLSVVGQIHLFRL